MLLVVLDAAVKSTLVLIIAWMATRAMRRCSAAARHFVWFLAVASLPLLPLLSWTLPGWQILPRWMNLQPEPAAATQPPALPPHPPPARFEASRGIEPAVANEPVATGPSVREPTRISPAPTAAPIDSPRSNPWRFVLLIWVAGAFLALLPLVLGRFSLWRLERGARRETAASWLGLLQQLLTGLKFNRAVDLLKTNRRRMPMTWGVIRPKLLLPEQSQEWTEDRRRVVMLHELAHAKRCDYLTNVVTQLACAMYWFNPLVWVAARQMIAERERACDDVVLRHGAKPSDYAEQLLHIAAGLPTDRFVVYAGIAMARPSKLESRLRAILDDRCNRATLTRLVKIAGLALLMVVVVPLAMMRAASTTKAKENVSADARVPNAGQPVTNASAETKHLDGLAVGGMPASFYVVWAEPGAPQFQQQVIPNPPRPLPSPEPDPSRPFVPPGERIISLTLNRTPLKDALAAACRAAHVEMDWDEESLKSSGLADLPITLSFKDARLDTVLQRISSIMWLEKGPGLILELQGEKYFFRAGRKRKWTVQDLPDWMKPLYNHGLNAELDADKQIIHIYMNGPDDDFLTKLATLPHLREVHLESTKALTPEGIAYLAKLPAIEALHLSDSGLGDEILHVVSRIKTLRELQVVSCRVTDAGARYLAGMTQLTNLSLEANYLLTDAGVKSLAGLTNLQHLDLSVCTRITDEGIKQLSRLTELRELFLSSLDLSGKTISFPHLQSLVLSGPLTEAGIDQIVQCHDLRHLALEGAPISDADLKRIATLKELRFLSLNSSHITDPGIAHLVALPKLTEFYLGGQLLTDESLRAVSRFPSLTHFTLRGSNDGRLTVQGLQQLKNSPQLCVLTIDMFNSSTDFLGLRELTRLSVLGFSMTRITPYEVAQLEEALPGTLIFDDSNSGGMRPRRSKSAGSTVHIFGQLVDQYGAPMVGKRIWLSRDPVPRSTDVFTETRTDQEGLFQFTNIPINYAWNFNLEDALPTRIKFLEAGDTTIQLSTREESGARTLVSVGDPQRPATLVVRSDDTSEVPTENFELTRSNPDNQNWRHRFSVRNHGELIMTGLRPGNYDLSREKNADMPSARTNRSSILAHFDYRSVVLEPGKTQRVDFVRTNSGVVRGTVIGLKELQAAGAYILVRSALATANLRKETELATYDVAACGPDGEFHFTALPPGNYTIVAAAYKKPLDFFWIFFQNRPAGDTFNEPGIRPDFVGATKVSVREDQSTEPVRIELQYTGGTWIYTFGTGNIRATLLDDATVRPITNFFLQAGTAKSSSASDLLWNPRIVGPIATGADGRFGLNAEETQQVWRVMAPGYAAETISGGTPEIVVRMKPAGVLRGVVSDWQGRPAAGAKITVTAVDSQMLTNAVLLPLLTNNATTDRDGRFSLPRPALGDVKLIVASRDKQMVQVVPCSSSDSGLKIAFPQPATLIVRYNIPGDEPKSKIGMSLRTFEMENPLWNGVQFIVTSEMTNGGELVFSNLKSGTYGLARQKSFSTEGRDSFISVEGRTLTLESGQTQRVDFVRSTGHVIHGIVAGLEALGVTNGTVSVRAGERNERGIDLVAFGKDGRFQTALVEPGTYYLSALVRSADAPRTRILSGVERPTGPTHAARGYITITADAEPPPVRLELITWDEANRLDQQKARTNPPVVVRLPESVQRKLDAQLPQRPPGISLNGHVLDAEKGTPIVDFVVQKGSTNFTTTNQIVWQHYTMGYAENQGAWSARLEDPYDRAVRILAPGYVPETLTRESLAGRSTSDLEVRLRRGQPVQGTVIDADGRPVSGARVYLTTVQPLYLEDGKTIYGPFKGDSTTTDNSGRFILRGEGGSFQKVAVVTADNHLVWPAFQSNPSQDLRIVLPRPGTLIVRYDIPGDTLDAKPEIRIVTTNKETPLWKDVSFALSFLVANRGQVVLSNLTPGTYNFRRWKLVAPNGGVNSDVQLVKVEAGQTQFLDLVRTNGQRIRGRVIGWDQIKSNSDGYIFVRSPDATGQPWPMRSRSYDKEFWLPYYDVSKINADGTFETAALNPGTYSIIAHVHPPAPVDSRGYRNSSPDFVGLAKITVASTTIAPVDIQLSPAQYVDIAGTVVDDATDAAINNYDIQSGTVDPARPGEISWNNGYSGGGQDGHFLLWAQREGVAWRFLANGYVPQVFLRDTVLASRKTAQLQVRLKRGGELHGVVLDHAGWPVASAKVVLAPAGRDDLPGKSAYLGRAGTGRSFAVTDAAGRFSLQGLGEDPSRLIAMSDDGQMVQPMLLPAGTKDIKISLPKPASLIVHYDIPGDTPELHFSLQLQTNNIEVPLWDGVEGGVWQKVANRGQFILNNLTPGTYTFSRYRRAGVTNGYDFIYGNPMNSVQSDLRTLVLESGRTQRVDLVRSTGQRVQGQVTGLKQITNSVGVFLYVGSATATRSPHDYETNLVPCFDAVKIGTDGRFETALLEPGDYSLIVEAFVPVKPRERKSVPDNEPDWGDGMWWTPPQLAYVGSAKVTVSAIASPTPVTIELRPHGEAANSGGGNARIPALNSPTAAASERKVSLRARQMPLKDALDAVCRQARVELNFDSEAFEFEGLTNVLVTATIQDEPLDSAVTTILDRLPWDHFIFHSFNGEKLLVSGGRIAEDRTIRALPDWLRQLYGNGLVARLDEDHQVIEISTDGRADDDFLAKLKTLPRLRELYVGTTERITPAGIARLAELPTLEKLRLYELKHNGVGLGNEALRALAGNRSLHELGIGGCGVTDDGLRAIERMTQLTELDLSGNLLTDAGMKSLAGLTNLQRLSLSGNHQLTDAGVKQLSRLTELRDLFVGSLQISDNALSLPHLRKLGRYGSVSESALNNPYIAPEILNTPGWGEAANGLQVRLRAPEPTVRAGKLPRLLVDIANHGPHELYGTTNTYCWQLEVDGRQYLADGMRGLSGNGAAYSESGGVLLDLLPGKPWANVPLVLDAAWRVAGANELAQRFGGGMIEHPRETQVLRLSPGKHTLRLMVFGEQKRAGGSSAQAVSNPLQIELE
jgi:beta-lactamase regulating signal transducer with metallopeptidase domain/Leucine-rich repeat (LRR) protein